MYKYNMEELFEMSVKKLEERAQKGLKGVETGQGFYKYK